MSQQRKFLIVLTIVAILFASWLLRRKPLHSRVSDASEIEVTNVIEHSFTNKSAPTSTQDDAAPARKTQKQDLPNETEQLKLVIENEVALWQGSIIYFGKVIDENDNPIVGAQAAYGANSMNQLREEVYNTGTATTDNRGYFKIEGVKGIGLMIQVSHPDYYPYPTNSTGFDKRSTPKKGYFSDSEEAAEVFRMHRKGNPVALIKRGGGLHHPLDGTAVNFPIRGKSRNEIVGHLSIQGWKDNLKKGEHSNWGVKISVPDGGVLEFTNYFNFIAPKTGYQAVWQLSVSKDDPNWYSQTSRQFFIKLKNHFIRAGVYIDVYHDLYFSMDYVLNPDGSPNLELDPAQVINPTQ